MLQAARRTIWGVMALLSVGIAVFSYRYLAGIGPLAAGVLQNAFARPWLDLHVAGAATALLTGPLQFVGAIRRARPAVHRWTGRAYAGACLTGAVGGFMLALGTTAGPVASAGFGVLAVLWIVTTAEAWWLAMQRRFEAHRAWMTRSFALTFAAVTLRIGLVVLPMAHVGLLDGYRALSFLCWVPNLAIAQLLTSRRARRPLQPQKTIVR